MVGPVEYPAEKPRIIGRIATARQLDRHTKEFVDRAEAATERMVRALDRELRAQITTLRRDIERALARSSGAKKASVKKAPAKKAAPKKAPARTG